MVGKRERFKLAIGNYQLGLLKGQTSKTATLVKRKDGSYYVNIQLESESPLPGETDQVLGVNLVRTDIAATSEGDAFSGAAVTAIREKYSDSTERSPNVNLKAKLQQKAARGTRSTRRRVRRLLQRLLGKEKRFQAHTNHGISYRLVQRAKVTH